MTANAKKKKWDSSLRFKKIFSASKHLIESNDFPDKKIWKFMIESILVNKPFIEVDIQSKKKCQKRNKSSIDCVNKPFQWISQRPEEVNWVGRQWMLEKIGLFSYIIIFHFVFSIEREKKKIMKCIDEYLVRAHLSSVEKWKYKSICQRTWTEKRYDMSTSAHVHEQANETE